MDLVADRETAVRSLNAIRRRRCGRAWLVGWDCGPPFRFLQVGGLALADMSVQLDMEFEDGPVAGAPQNLEMLRFPSRLGDHLEAVMSDRLDRSLRVRMSMRSVVVVLLAMFDPDRFSVRLGDLGDLDLGRLLLACQRDLVAFLESDQPDGLGPDVGEVLGARARDDESMGEDSDDCSGDRGVMMSLDVLTG